MSLAELNKDISSEDTITISRKEYSELKAIANGYKLQTEFFTKIRNELIPTDKDIHLPWYEMLYKCIKNKQLKD